MPRVNIYQDDDFDGPVLIGWFDPGKARRIDEDTRFDGHNLVGVITGSPWVREYLYRTAGGRWVHERDAHRDNNGPDIYSFFTDEQAKDWLLRNGSDDATGEYFGEIEEERGPGRPSEGVPISTRYRQDQLDAVDARAAARSQSRADILRELLDQALAL